jgi:hypothetical protein
MSLPQTLENIFGAFVNQGTLEEAATWMADLTVQHPSLADQFTTSLMLGCAGKSDTGISVIEAVTKSGYYANSKEEAVALCEELLRLYLHRIGSITSEGVRS